jgi:hypothetical protein
MRCTVGGPQRAAQLVAEHEGRKRHGPTIARDKLARDEVGAEIEIAHAPTRVSKQPNSLGALDRAR